MRLLVTGGCGFIGSHFMRQRLLDRNEGAPSLIVNLDALTYAADRDSLGELPASLTVGRCLFSHGNIADSDLLDHLFATHDFDAVLHLAAESHVDRSIDDPEPFLQTNIIGTQRLIDATLSHLVTLPPSRREKFRFVHVSTDEVYGSLMPGEPAFTEESPLKPNSPYAASKAAADLLVRAARQTHGLPAIITRCSNNYGPRQFPEKLIPLILLNALDARPLPVYGDGLQVRDWLHVEDHVSALWLILQHGAPGATYHIAGGAERTNLDLVRTLCAELDRQAPRSDAQAHADHIEHVADRPGHDRRYAINDERLRTELDWRPRHELGSGLAETVSWYLRNRPWCEAISSTRYSRQRLGRKL